MDSNELQQEYFRQCAQLGELTYRIHVFEAERAKLYKGLKELNAKAASEQKKAEAKEKAAKAMEQQKSP